MIKFIIFVLITTCGYAYADQYYQSPNGAISFLSTDDIKNGGESMLPAGSQPITATQAAAVQQQMAAASQSVSPNPSGFQAALKSTLGGIIGANSLMVAYPAFLPALQQSQWADLQALIVDANSKSVITPTQYAAIKAAAISNNIPVTLP